MKTKTIPVMLMLVAGAITSILGFVNYYETTYFFTMLLTVLVVFYMLGCIVKVIIDKNFSNLSAKKAETSEKSEETKENIESGSQVKADE